MSVQPAQPIKFNEKTFRSEMSNYIKYLKCSWKMALEVAEGSIGPSPNPDDIEAADRRRCIVYDLATMIFSKMTLDYYSAWGMNLWAQMQGKGTGEAPSRPMPRRDRK